MCTIHGHYPGYLAVGPAGQHGTGEHAKTINPTGNEDMTRIRNFFAALSRRFRGFRGGFAGFAAVSRRFCAASHTAQWCLRKDSQPFRKVSQLRICVIP